MINDLYDVLHYESCENHVFLVVTNSARGTQSRIHRIIIGSDNAVTKYSGLLERSFSVYFTPSTTNLITYARYNSFIPYTNDGKKFQKLVGPARIKYILNKVTLFVKRQVLRYEQQACACTFAVNIALRIRTTIMQPD